MQYMFLMMSEEAGWGEMPPRRAEEWLERYRGFRRGHAPRRRGRFGKNQIWRPACRRGTVQYARAARS